MDHDQHVKAWRARCALVGEVCQAIWIAWEINMAHMLPHPDDARPMHYAARVLVDRMLAGGLSPACIHYTLVDTR